MKGMHSHLLAVTNLTSIARHPVSRSRAPFPGTLMVKGSRSRYHGQNDRITLLNQVGLFLLTYFP